MHNATKFIVVLAVIGAGICCALPFRRVEPDAGQLARQESAAAIDSADAAKASAAPNRKNAAALRAGKVPGDSFDSLIDDSEPPAPAVKRRARQTPAPKLKPKPNSSPPRGGAFHKFGTPDPPPDLPTSFEPTDDSESVRETHADSFAQQSDSDDRSDRFPFADENAAPEQPGDSAAAHGHATDAFDRSAAAVAKTPKDAKKGPNSKKPPNSRKSRSSGTPDKETTAKQRNGNNEPSGEMAAANAAEPPRTADGSHGARPPAGRITGIAEDTPVERGGREPAPDDRFTSSPGADSSSRADSSSHADLPDHAPWNPEPAAAGRAFSKNAADDIASDPAAAEYRPDSAGGFLAEAPAAEKAPGTPAPRRGERGSAFAPGRAASQPNSETATHSGENESRPPLASLPAGDAAHPTRPPGTGSFFTHPAIVADPSSAPDHSERDQWRSASRDPRATEPENMASTSPARRPSNSTNAGVQAGATQMVRHRVVDGDSLASLAERYLGSPYLYLEVFNANRDVLASPDLLPIGVELRMPPRTAANGLGPGTPGTSGQGAAGQPSAWGPAKQDLVPIPTDAFPHLRR